VFLLLVVVIAVGACVVWYQAGGKYRWSEPYKAALAQVRKDPQVIAQLGEPIHDVLFTLSGSVYGENANLTFKVAGPKGRATVQADARAIAGKWGLRMLTVTFADLKRISLNTSSGEGGEGDAPKWPATGSTPAPPKPPAEAPKVPPPASPGPDIQLDMPDLNAPANAPAGKKASDPKPAAK
jgi:hypothetical protein